MSRGLGDVYKRQDTYEVSCEMERKRVECAIMIKAALADQERTADYEEE